MNPHYTIRDVSGISSPALFFFKDLIQRNIAHAAEMAGGAARLRPHVKTHKTREIVQMSLAAGVTKYKCATLAEAEMVASTGAPDVLLAYQLVGPNCARMAKLMQAYPRCRFSVLLDHPDAAALLSQTMKRAGLTLDVFLDLDVGQHRTGIAPGEEALALYESMAKLPGLRAAGFHVYDGHNHQENYVEREEAVQRLLAPVLVMRSTLEQRGCAVPRLIVGGTPTFPVFARIDLPGIECSPGTLFLYDHGYGSKFVDLNGFTPAALLLTRVISKPTSTRLTLDLGYKAVASDPPAGKRCVLLNVPDYTPMVQNEEHFVVETPAAGQFPLGTEVWAMPTHICPTCAMHRHAYVVENGEVMGTWDIIARDRKLSV
jgi:D-serine deaminase-like pyridoxal phosphate-dependent protein